MSVTIEPAGTAHATYVAAYLRQMDVLEFRAVFGASQDIPSVVAAVTGMSGERAYVAMDNGNPVLVFGVLRQMPHQGLAWGWGTDKAWRAIPAVGRFVRRSLIPQLLLDGVHRVEVRVMSANSASVHWLAKHMGARHETTLPDFGVQREQFEQYAWLRSDFENV